MADLEQRPLAACDLEHLSKENRRLLDQFAYRYTRLQDDMGARLMPAILRALGEEVAAMPALDRLNRLEQLGWLPSAEEWVELRRIRNEFAHDYPATAQERLERLQLAFSSARRLLEILAILDGKIQQRFPKMGQSSQGDGRGVN
ncbi:hypothetical protein [Pelomicrobium methylotrophicum]|uniref:Nucleotidyltransferase substrate binding protein like protein n=1 Tax=Pelomicrobium methylotrophicum TaxID=2602750 RepID=A0A5C7ENN5_9PROT|nr:hypothetical protein [Pelomicrobium methylotrophicum]TXF13361.1 hypothetical protein FR698_02160 [Pelomicrobium methylotrophicum]